MRLTAASAPFTAGNSALLSALSLRVTTGSVIGYSARASRVAAIRMSSAQSRSG